MSVASHVALGFGVLRGFQLAALTVPWLRQKIRRAEATEAERSLVLMAASRSILLGLVMLALGLSNRRNALGWVLIGDASLQLFDALHALAMRKRAVAALPAILCVLDGLAALALLA